MKISSPEMLREKSAEFRRELEKYTGSISVCGGTGCRAAGCLKVRDAVEFELKRHDLAEKIRLVVTGCHGFCQQGPIVVVKPSGIFYGRVKPDWVEEIIEKTVISGEPIKKYLYHTKDTKEAVPFENDIPFYSKQVRPLLGNNSNIDPNRIEDAIAYGAYQALSKALYEIHPEKIIDEIKQSGLRGRGGGGFSTGRKWASCAKAHGQHKWVICNADEGDPGAFMDESILEGNPHLVVEGMIIAARAIGGTGGFVYVRNEYPLALERITLAIEQAREWGFLGENILGSGLNFDIRINRGGGAFVCGESTALMASLEGKSGEPRAKYIHTVEHGYHDEPSLLNNVETYANVPGIILNGAQKYRELGTDGSPGTKIFSLVGKVTNTGLVEIPMGTTIRELVVDIGGGAPKKKKLKAVQTGGPSGGCLPESLFDLQVDFDALTGAGSMMGSGGIIVMDEDSCMVDVAKYFIRFLKSESCGKCTPCREGLNEMDRILSRITSGEGRESDLDYLEELGAWMSSASLCGLGTSAPNPVMSTLRYFRDEYLAHINDQKCPGGTCRDLLRYEIIEEMCNGCTVCIKACPGGAITGEVKKPHVIDPLICTKCGACYEVCKFDAIRR